MGRLSGDQGKFFCDFDIDEHVPADHVLRRCMGAGLVGGEGFAIDASVLQTEASRYQGRPGDETFDWTDPKLDTRAQFGCRKPFCAGKMSSTGRSTTTTPSSSIDCLRFSPFRHSAIFTADRPSSEP